MTEAAYYGHILLVEKEGRGRCEPGLAKTEWGIIPGKCKEGKCWFTFEGTAKSTESFDRIVGTETDPIRFIPFKENVEPPSTAIAGNEKGQSTPIYAAIADTEWGLIPGKAQGNTCWYHYGGQERTTKNFFWLDRGNK